MDTFDLAVIGAGAAGLAAAQIGRALGRRVVLVEEARLGGDCTWTGCVPSKALIETARRRHEMLGADRRGIKAPRVTVDFAQVMAHVQDVVGQVARYEDADHLRDQGIEVRRGHARVVGPTTLLVGSQVIPTGRTVIATGSSPAVPPITGLENVRYLTNENVFELTTLPRHLLVLGAGPVGLELAQAFRRLGSAVTIVDVLGSILEGEDPDIATRAHALLAGEGVEFRLGAKVAKIAVARNRLRMTINIGAETEVLTGDELLVATGRRPNIDGLGLEALGVRSERWGLGVDDHCRTAIPEIYAAGDVTGLFPFTHAAAYQGRIAARNAMGIRVSADYRVMPWVIFTDPEIGHLGLTEPEARALYGSVSVAKLPYTAIDRAVIQGRVQGVIKVITRRTPVSRAIREGTRLLGRRVDPGGEIVGAHIIGANAGEMLQELALSMQTHGFAGRLAQTMHAYPTMALGVQQAIAQLFPGGRATAGDLRSDLIDQ